MSKGLKRSLSKSQPVKIQNLVYKMKDLALAVTDGAPGFGSSVVGKLPIGNILFLGCAAYLQLSTSSATITSAFTGSFSLGSSATVDGDLSDTAEANFTVATTLAAATAKVSPLTRATNSAGLSGAVLDNTDGTLNLNLNVLIDDAEISGAASFLANGNIFVSLLIMGDD